MSDELRRFVHDALTRGLPRQEIRSAARSAGWPEDAVDAALAGWADVDFPLPVPRPRPYLSAREAFLYLVLFSTLYASAISLGTLLFEFVERAWPDPTRPVWELGSARTVRWSTSWLLITFPVFLWLSRSTRRMLRREPEKRASRIRKWLIYLTLFVAASALLCDLVALVFNLLAGELTVRFLLKVAAVAAIAGVVFWYLSQELREDDATPEESSRPHPQMRWLAAGTAVVVAAAVVGGLVVAGSPGRARALQLDDRRESDLAAIAGAVDRYWSWHERLPASLEALAGERRVTLQSIEDPTSGERYEYRVTGERSYELCAEFALPDREAEIEPSPLRPESRFWRHGAGRHCFDVEVRDEE